MKLIDLFEYQTKTGQEIDVTFVEDSEGDDNRGWQVDRIDAFVDGKYAGYIKLAYIPHNRFVKYYPSIYNYLDQIKGKLIHPQEKQHVHYNKLTNDERRKMYERLNSYYRFVGFGDDDKLKEMSDKEILTALRAFEKKLNDSTEGREFRKFKNFHKDKPLVDYINVEKDMHRQRIGEALYKEAAKWMKEKGMQVYGSGVQSEQAKRSWENMKRQGIVKKAKRGRKYLDVDNH